MRHPVLLVPYLPRKVKVHVAKCYQSQPRAISATPITQRVCLCSHASYLPCRRNVHIAKFHICHVKSHSIHGVNWAQARHQSQPSAISATPRKVIIHVTQYRTCRAKCKSMSSSAMPANPKVRRPRRQLGPKCATRASPVP